jgi:hypothetical protein
LRLLAVELVLAKPAPGVWLHLLLTLSALLSMALSTNPPIPLVGEGGRAPIGDLRSPGDGSSFGASKIDAGGDFILIDPTSVAAVVLE